MEELKYQNVERIRIFTFLGDFSRWDVVPYVIEDVLKQDKRIILHLYNRVPYASFFTGFALLSHYVTKYNIRNAELRIYTPITLIASRKMYQDFSNKVSEVERCHRALCEGDLTTQDILDVIVKAFREKIKDAEKSLEERKKEFKERNSEWLKGLKELKDLHEQLRSILEQQDSTHGYTFSEQLKTIGKSVNIKIVFLPIPLTLTQVIKYNSQNRIVTFRIENAAETLEGLLLVDAIYTMMEDFKCREGGDEEGFPKLMYVFDLTHGINYAPSVTMRILERIVWFVESYFEVTNKRETVILRVHNSDPVLLPPLKLGGEEAYKIHLVYERELGQKTYIPQSALKDFVGREARFAFRRLNGNLGNVLKNVFDLNEGEESKRLVKELEELLRLASASLLTSLIVWSHHYSTLLKRRLDEFNIDMDEVFKRLHNKCFMINPSVRKDESVTRVNYELYVDGAHLSDTVTVIYLVKLLRDLHDKTKLNALKLESTEVKESVGDIKSFLRISIAGSGKRKEYIEADLKLLSRVTDEVSAVLLENEFIQDKEKAGKCYCGSVRRIDERNLFAHAGLARGVSINVCYEMLGNNAVLSYALLADSKHLRDILKRKYP